MAYLNLDGDRFSSYPRDFNGKMSLVLTAMLAKDYLKKYANIRERYTGYYDSASDVMRYVDDFSKPNTLRESVWFSCDETVKISFWDTRDEREQKGRYLDALAQFHAWVAQSHRVSGCPAGAEGLWPCEGSSMYGQGHNPPPPIGGAPFAQGGLLCLRRSGFYIHPWSFATARDCTGEQCSPLQPTYGRT